VQLELILMVVAGLWVVVTAWVLSLCLAARRGDTRLRETAAGRAAAGPSGSARVIPLRPRVAHR
jgi:hypothetical protein